MKELINIISELKAPKSQYNSFGKYKYRSCEDILEAVKPLLAKHQVLLTITDDVTSVGDHIYIKATATVTNSEGQQYSASAFAREELEKKGMDASQITGSASSYARKYALNGLFCIDDTKDADATNKHGQDEAPKEATKRDYFAEALAELQNCKKQSDVVALNNNYLRLIPKEKMTEYTTKRDNRYRELPA